LGLSGHPQFFSLIVGQCLDRYQSPDPRLHRCHPSGGEIKHVEFAIQIVIDVLSRGQSIQLT